MISVKKLKSQSNGKVENSHMIISQKLQSQSNNNYNEDCTICENWFDNIKKLKFEKFIIWEPGCLSIHKVEMTNLKDI